jgi:hypothetical protein
MTQLLGHTFLRKLTFIIMFIGISLLRAGLGLKKLVRDRLPPQQVVNTCLNKFWFKQIIICSYFS